MKSRLTDLVKLKKTAMTINKTKVYTNYCLPPFFQEKESRLKTEIIELKT